MPSTKFMPEYKRILIEEIGKYSVNIPTVTIFQELFQKYKSHKDFANLNPDSFRRRAAEIRDNLPFWKERLKAEKKAAEERKNQTHPKIVIENNLKEKNLHEKLSEQNKFVEHLLTELKLKDKALETFTFLSKSARRAINIVPTRGIDSQAAACIMCSDWHLEEYVDPSTVNGLNEYNLDIARTSVSNCFSNGLRLVEICQKDVHIDTIVLILNGDIINGYIHEEFVEDNLLSPTEASLLGLDLISSGINYLLKHSKCKLKVICKFGNHGRTTIKSRVATGYKNSYEWMVFQLVAREYRGDSRVEVVVDNSYLTYVDIYGYTLRIHHGDNIGYQGGVGGVTIPLNKAIAQWNKHKTAYLDVVAHFHQLQLDTGSFRYVMNGSIVGYNAYAIKIKAAFEEPKQGFFLIDSKRGKTITAPIFVRELIGAK
jgi:hypothetical protein